MKKLFSMASLFILAFTVTGCEEATVVTCDPGYELVGGECEEVVPECADNEELVGNACVVIETIDLDFVFIDFDGNEVNLDVSLDDEYEGTFTELITAEFDVMTMPSDYGTLLLTIEELVPMMGSYIAILKNDEMSMVGIDEMTFEDGDEFEFVLTWWDPTAEAVYNAIDLFIENQVENYVSAEYIDYNVFAALALLGITEDYVTDVEVTAYITATYPELTMYTDYFKVMSIKTSAGLDIAAEAEGLNGIMAVGGYGQTAYTLLAMEMDWNTQGSFDYDAMNYYVNNFVVGDIDTNGIDLIAASLIEDEVMQTDVVDQFALYVQENLELSGGIKTQPIVWDGVEYPGTENAASMSMVIMGLVANGIDPNGLDYTSEEGNTLITRLLEFQTETGTFDWVLDDEIMEDAVFSTPQAFLALVSYFTYSNTFAPVNPYYFVIE